MVITLIDTRVKINVMGKKAIKDVGLAEKKI